MSASYRHFQPLIFGREVFPQRVNTPPHILVLIYAVCICCYFAIFQHIAATSKTASITTATYYLARKSSSCLFRSRLFISIPVTHSFTITATPSLTLLCGFLATGKFFGQKERRDIVLLTCFSFQARISGEQTDSIYIYTTCVTLSLLQREGE